MDSETKEIFRQNSTSYYYSSLFFPEDVREDVFELYAYVRTADDFVDEIPQDEEGFRQFKQESLSALESGDSKDRIIDQFVKVYSKNGVKKEWVEAFLNSMEMDLYRSDYESIEDSLEYIHGSAEVIGLMMSEILSLEKEAKEPAKKLGRAMQYCNFIRDIEEDNRLGRQYLPEEELDKYDLDSLEEEYARENPEKFEDFMNAQLDRYWEWEKEAIEGFKYIPYRYRVPVKLSAKLYEYTAEKIREDPFMVYDKKVRPSKPRIALKLLKSLRG